MKIGDKVRFLNEVGGGIVSGFQGKNIVLVEDQDGFDIPVNINDCVVVDNDNYSLANRKKNTPSSTTVDNPQPTSIKAGLNKELPESEELPIEELPITFKPAPVERSNAEALNVFLCFVPIEVAELTKSDFEVYLVNDSNYYLDFTYLTGEGKGWNLRYRSTAEPNTKHFIECFSRDDLNELQHICIQILAYKENKSFMLKTPQSIEIRPDLTRFFKLHTFQSNLFFEERVLTFDIMTDDKPVHHVFSDASTIKEALTAPNKKESSQPHVHAITLKKEHKEAIEVIDLHAHELLDNTRGMNASDILEYQLDVFRKIMEQHINQKGKKIVFIHGKGQGVLRNALLRELTHKYKKCTSQDASFREYGFGATLVTIY